MSRVGWRRLAQLKKGENIVGSFISRLIKLNPEQTLNPIDRLQQLFSEQSRLADGFDPERLSVVESEIQKISSELNKKRRL